MKGWFRCLRILYMHRLVLANHRTVARRRLIALVLGSLFMWCVGEPASAAPQEEDQEVQPPAPSPTEIVTIQAKCLALLGNVQPAVGLSMVPYVHKPDQPCKTMELAGGTIRWGNLFAPGETVALVNLAPSEKLNPEDPFEHPPQFLCWYVWQGDHWSFRQFLGNVYELEVHHRQDHPSTFLQGWRSTGRYSGDCLSWSYDAAKRQLVRTHFEGWGPFYLAGDYLVLTRGGEHTAHNTTHWVHAYRDGKKGRFLACLHEHDSGTFDVTFRDPASGQMTNWLFQSLDQEGSRLSVSVGEPPADVGRDFAEAKSRARTAELTGDSQSAEQYFGLLTGINPAVLKGWADRLPRWQVPRQFALQGTGDRAILARLRGSTHTVHSFH